MSNSTPQLSTAEAIGAALTTDAAMHSRAELRQAILVLGVIVLLIVATLLLVWMFGLAAATMVSLLATALVFLLLIAYAAGK